MAIGAGLEGDELYNYMAQHGITVVAPGDGTVGMGGGWIASGGHGTLVSYLGLGADQVLSLNVVTADGGFVTASPLDNEDLFFALRGGGGSEHPLVCWLFHPHTCAFIVTVSVTQPTDQMQAPTVL